MTKFDYSIPHTSAQEEFVLEALCRIFSELNSKSHGRPPDVVEIEGWRDDSGGVRLEKIFTNTESDDGERYGGMYLASDPHQGAVIFAAERILLAWDGSVGDPDFASTVWNLLVSSDAIPLDATTSRANGITLEEHTSE